MGSKSNKFKDLLLLRNCQDLELMGFDGIGLSGSVVRRAERLEKEKLFEYIGIRPCFGEGEVKDKLTWRLTDEGKKFLLEVSKMPIIEQMKRGLR